MINGLYKLFGGNAGAKAEVVPVERTAEAAKMLAARAGTQRTARQADGQEIGLPRKPKIGFSDPPPPMIETYRKMSRYPTIHVCDTKILSPQLITEWSWETADESIPDQMAVEMAAEFDQFRSHLIRHCGYARAYGRQFFEVVWGATGAAENFVPLLVDDTSYLQDNQTKQIIGIRNKGADGVDIDLSPANAWAFRRTGEGDSLSGTPSYENSREQWWWALQAIAKFAQYLKRICNVIPKVTYPRGTSQDVSGAERPNSWMAAQILSDLQDGAGVAVLNEYASMVLAGDKTGLLSGEVIKKALEAAGLSPWVIDAIDPGGVDYCQGFVNSVEYFDYNIVRGQGLPEQSVLHTRYGARSTGQQHDNTADMVSENDYREFCEQFNKGPLNRRLVSKYGPQAKGAVRVVQPALSAENSEGSQKVLETLAANKDTGAALATLLDIPQMADDLHMAVNPLQRAAWPNQIKMLMQQAKPPIPPGQNGNGHPPDPSRMMQ